MFADLPGMIVGSVQLPSARFQPSTVRGAGRDSGIADLHCSNVSPIACLLQNRSCAKRLPALIQLCDNSAEHRSQIQGYFSGSIRILLHKVCLISSLACGDN